MWPDRQKMRKIPLILTHKICNSFLVNNTLLPFLSSIHGLQIIIHDGVVTIQAKPWMPSWSSLFWRPPKRINNENSIYLSWLPNGWVWSISFQEKGYQKHVWYWRFGFSWWYSDFFSLHELILWCYKAGGKIMRLKLPFIPLVDDLIMSSGYKLLLLPKKKEVSKARYWKYNWLSERCSCRAGYSVIW